MNASNFKFTPQALDRIRELAGKRPGRDIADELGCSYGSLRHICSRHGISLRFGIAPEEDPERPAADDRAVARIDAMRPRTVELNGVILSAEVMNVLTREAAGRNTTVKALVAKLASIIAIDGLTDAVLDEGR